MLSSMRVGGLADLARTFWVCGGGVVVQLLGGRDDELLAVAAVGPRRGAIARVMNEGQSAESREDRVGVTAG